MAGVHKARLPEFRADPERAYRAAIARVPDAPALDEAEQASKLLGKLDVPNVMRPAARSGVAFVGDAALATDPTMGVGCGWAFQSAEWLVDHTAAALMEGGDLDAALARYRRTFQRRLGLHHWLIADLSTGRMLRWNERVTFQAAARDEAVAREIEVMVSRRKSPLPLLSPGFALRSLRAGLGSAA